MTRNFLIIVVVFVGALGYFYSGQNSFAGKVGALVAGDQRDLVIFEQIRSELQAMNQKIDTLTGHILNQNAGLASQPVPAPKPKAVHPIKITVHPLIQKDL